LPFTIYMIVINISFWLILNYGVAYGSRLLPKGIFTHNFFFREKSFERNLYKSIRINKWKDKLPAVNSTLKKLKIELNPQYLDKMIMQTYYAEFGHLTIAILGFLCILVNPNEYFLMAFICSIVNFFIHIPYCLIQRYNRPRLLKVKSRLANKKVFLDVL
jgi:glycosyl-4,4'-diaponeurosporenoate acyltransferase